MRIVIPALLLACTAASAPVIAAEPAPATQDCLNNKDIRAKRLSAEQGYYAQTRTGWWHNTGAACPAFAKNRALVTRSTSNRQCKGDVVEIVDPFSRIAYGGCTLGAWERVAAPPADDK